MKKEKTTPTEAPQLKPEISEVQPEPQKSVKQSKIMKVGAMLKEMRLQKDLKLNDVSKQLCIRKHYLESIEESAYGDIPPLPYGIGFIRSYAKFLGLNSENIVDLYKEETHISEPTGMHVLEPQAEASVPSFYYLVISVAAIALLSVGWLVYNRSSSPVEESVVEYNDTSDNGGVIVVEEFSTEQLVPEAPAVEEEPSVQEEQPQVKVTEEVYQEPEVKEVPETKTPEVPDEPEKKVVVREPIVVPNTGIFIEIVKESWIEVKDDTKLYLSKVLQPGESYTVPNGPGMILSVGKPEGVVVYINGVETPVVRPNKKMNIALDEYLNDNH